MRGPGACPRVEGLAGPVLLPVGWKSRLALRVRNLQHFGVSGGLAGVGVACRVQRPDSVPSQSLPASYHCWLELPGKLQRLPASLEETSGDVGLISCQAQQVCSRPTASPAALRRAPHLTVFQAVRVSPSLVRQAWCGL